MLPIAAQHEPTHAPHKNTDLNFISKEMRKHWFFCRWYFLARNKNFTERLPSTLMQSDPDRCGKALLVRNMYTYAHSSVQCPRKGHNQRVKKKKSQNRAIPITTSAPTALNTTVVALPYTQDVPFTRFCFWSVHAQRCELVKNSAKHRNKYGNNKAHLNSKQITGSSVLWATSDLAKKKRFGGCLPSERIHSTLCPHWAREIYRCSRHERQTQLSASATAWPVAWCPLPLNPPFFLPADSGHKSCTEGMEQYTAMKDTANTEMAWPKQRNELSTGTMLSLISRY